MSQNIKCNKKDIHHNPNVINANTTLYYMEYNVETAEL